MKPTKLTNLSCSGWWKVVDSPSTRTVRTGSCSRSRNESRPASESIYRVTNSTQAILATRDLGFLFLPRSLNWDRTTRTICATSNLAQCSRIGDHTSLSSRPSPSNNNSSIRTTNPSTSPLTVLSAARWTPTQKSQIKKARAILHSDSAHVRNLLPKISETNLSWNLVPSKNNSPKSLVSKKHLALVPVSFQIFSTLMHICTLRSLKMTNQAWRMGKFVLRLKWTKKSNLRQISNQILKATRSSTFNALLANSQRILSKRGRKVLLRWKRWLSRKKMTKNSQLQGWFELWLRPLSLIWLLLN